MYLVDAWRGRCAAGWGGVTLNGGSGGSIIDGADIGHAVVPVFLESPDSTTIRSTRIHHFSDVGLWVHESPGDGVVLEGLTIERGTGLLSDRGDVGVFLDRADEVLLVGSVVDLTGLEAESGGTGILVSWGETFCDDAPADSQSMVIDSTLVIGPGLSVSEGEDYVGLRLSWVCGGSGRAVDVMENGIDGWAYSGMEFYQSSDVQVSCNAVTGSSRAADIYRDDEPTGTSLRFRENRLEALTRSSSLYALRTNDAATTKLGPNQPTKGKNRLIVNADDTPFIYESDADSTVTLNASNNFWLTDSVGTRVLLEQTADIEGRIAPSGFGVDVSGFYTIPVTDPCAPPEMTAGREPLAPREREARFDRDGDPSVPPITLTEVLRLSAPFPNPARQTVEMVLDVPRRDAGTFDVGVYDVRGRLVRSLSRTIHEPGRYRIVWGGEDEKGRRVGNGIYFVRVRGPEAFLRNSKVVVLR